MKKNFNGIILGTCCMVAGVFAIPPQTANGSYKPTTTPEVRFHYDDQAPDKSCLWIKFQNTKTFVKVNGKFQHIGDYLESQRLVSCVPNSDFLYVVGLPDELLKIIQELQKQEYFEPKTKWNKNSQPKLTEVNQPPIDDNEVLDVVIVEQDIFGTCIHFGENVFWDERDLFVIEDDILYTVFDYCQKHSINYANRHHFDPDRFVKSNRYCGPNGRQELLIFNKNAKEVSFLIQSATFVRLPAHKHQEKFWEWQVGPTILPTGTIQTEMDKLRPFDDTIELDTLERPLKHGFSTVLLPAKGLAFNNLWIAGDPEQPFEKFLRNKTKILTYSNHICLINESLDFIRNLMAHLKFFEKEE